MRRLLMPLFLCLIAASQVLMAAGKIRGKVVDSGSKEPLIGANVALLSTTFGASTDINGDFTIVNVPAGTYTLRATFVGYSSMTISNIRVNNDLTTTLDFRLVAETVSIQGIDIVAERPLVNKNATNAVRITTGENISQLPVRTVNDIIALSPGVVLKDNTVFIRGGRRDEVGFYLEGVSVTNPMIGGNAVSIVQDAIEEIQVQAGGYNAEFGGANSGIVQQQLKTGTSDWKGSAQFITDNVTFKSKENSFDGKKQLGAYWYGYNEFTGTLGGPVVDERIKFFGLFNYLYQRDQNPQPYPGINVGTITGQTGNQINLVYPAGALKKNPLERYNSTGTLTLDYKPVMVRTSGTYTSSTQFNAYNSSTNAGAIANLLNTDRIEQVDVRNGSGNIKLTHFLNSNTFYEVSGGYFYQTQNNFDPLLKDNFLSYGDSVANAAVGVNWQRTANDLSSGQIGRYLSPTRLMIFDQQFNAAGDVVSGYAKTKRENLTFAGSLSTQIGSQHSVKVGGEYQRYSIRNYAFNNRSVMSLAGLLSTNDALPANDPNKVSREQVLINAGVDNYGYDVFGNERDNDDLFGPKHPVFASFYIQDKIEYNDLIINAGVRYDYINTHNKMFTDPLHPENTINRFTGEINPAGLREVSSYSGVSPRIGLSFPVTDRTVFHTQFGQFVQQTRLRDIYQGLYLTAANVRGGFFINLPVGFDVRPTRTTQYEVGFTQQVGEIASFDITGYYKDIKDQVIYEEQNTGDGSPLGAYYVYKNGDYATTKGVEITFTMRREKRLQINSSLSFQDAQGTGSFPNSNRGIVGAPLDNVTQFKPQYVSPLEFNNAIAGSINIDYRFGKNDGGPILEQLGVAALLTFNSGHPYTRGIGGQDLEGEARSRSPIEPLNSSTTPWVFQVNVRVDKSFAILDRLSANVFVDVINLFDIKNVQNVFLRTGTTTDDGYLNNPDLGQKLIQSYGPQYAPVYRSINIDYYERYQNAIGLMTVPYFYGPPRQIRLGLRLEY
ncbi:MAG: TonB-dependent receptor [Ignavibacteriales bacterium]|nr:TonB-dependent receptor [Ignavibacteriales bacterium]